MTDEFPSLETVDYTNNREERLPCILLVDGSGSMAKDDAIGALNAGLKAFEAALKKDAIASLRVQVKVIRFGGNISPLTPWCDAMDFSAPEVHADGNTPMGGAVEFAMREVKDQLRDLQSRGISVKRPWIWLMSDGMPTDPGWEEVAKRCCDEQRSSSPQFFMYPVSVINDPTSTAHTDALAKFHPKGDVIRIQGAEFEAFFNFITQSAIQGSAEKRKDVNVFDFSAANQRIMPA